MESSDLPRDWVRGLIEPCILALLLEGEAYGYALAARLSDAGLGPVPGGSLYPALLRLEKLGFLSSQWTAGDGGPGRKYYKLTAAGRGALRRYRSQWQDFRAAVGGLLEPAMQR